MLKERLKELENELATNATTRQALAEQSRYLDRLEGFTADAAGAELRNGLLDAESLERITLFSFAQRERLAARRDELERAWRALTIEMTQVRGKLAELEAQRAKPVHQAVVRVTKTQPGRITLRLRYTVDRVKWRPAYTVRARLGSASIELEQAAELVQATGEDWTAVALTLTSTAPGDTAKAPDLEPLEVRLKKGPPGKQAAIETGARQLQELNSDPRPRRLDGVSTNLQSGFERTLEGARTLYHRAETQRVSIATHRLDTDTYHLAKPLIDQTVYREAKGINTTGDVILLGKVSVYFDDAYVGVAHMPTVPPGESFRVGLGADPHVQAVRKLKSREEEEQASRRVVTLTYLFEVRNSHEATLDLRLVDRLPIASEGSGLEVTDLSSTELLSTDASYLEHERPAGLLRWRAEVPPAPASEPWKFEYGYTVSMDRSFHLALSETPGSDKRRRDAALSPQARGLDGAWTLDEAK